MSNTTADKLQLLQQTKQAIRTEINFKGGSLTESDPFSSYASAIANLLPPGTNLDDVLDGSVTSITSDVTSLTQYGLAYKTSLTLVTLNSVTTIPAHCFEQDSNLQTISFNDATYIDEYAFYYCSNLIGISSTEFSSVTSIGQFAFEYSGISQVDLPDVVQIGTYSFAFCTNLGSVHLASIQDVPQYAFYGCSNLVNVTLENCIGISGHSFEGCSSLAIMTLSYNGVVDLTNVNAFDGVQPSGESMLTIYVPASLVSSYEVANNWSTLFNNNKVTFVAIQE